MLEPEPSPAAEQPPHEYRPDIDGLRAMAVLAVVIFHAQPQRLRGGFIGVDVFFVISGYLITGIILERQKRGRFTIRDFYARRIRRIFPALSVVLAAALAAGWFFLLPVEYAELGKDTAGGAGFISNLLLWKEINYFGPDVNSKLLLHLWSLGIEEQYYFVWPLLIVTLWRTRWRLVPIVAMLVASFALNIYQSYVDPRAAFYSPFARLWELLLGSVIAYTVAAHGEPLTLFSQRIAGADRERTVRDGAATLGLALILAGFALISDQSRFPGWWVLLPTLGTALLICAGPQTVIGRIVLSNRAMVAVGLISYPLYLWHWPALVFLRLQFPTASTVAKLGTLTCVFVASWLTYRFVERYARRERGVGVVSTLCAAMAVLLVAGPSLQYARGLPDRGDEVHRRIFAATAPGTKAAKISCFIQNQNRAKDFDPSCFPTRRDSSTRSVLLWGDSYAAHLIAAMPLERAGVHFAWLTGAGCPPIIGYGDASQPHCTDMLPVVVDSVRRNPPDLVILAANWHAYRRYAEVERTLAFLREVGVRDILVIGSFAQFTDDAPRLMLRAASHGTVPQRFPAADMRRLTTVDSSVRALATRYGATFRSPIERQCNAQGCMAALDTAAIGVLVFDKGHLTTAGAKWLTPQLLAGVIP
jgi:peptidoglycan/LPS O-acetylase OafA/YrhL